MKTIIKPTSDIFIKYLFGSEENKDLLLDFINDVLTDSGFEKIVSVEIKNPFNIKTFTVDKETVLDVKATDENGKIYNIEIQTTNHRCLKNRFLYYWAKLYSGQLEESEKYNKLCPVISINLVTFDLFDNIKNYHSCFMLKEKDSKDDTVLTEHLQIHFIELSKFENFIKERYNIKNINEVDNIIEIKKELDRWLYYFTLEGKVTEEKMQVLLKDEIIEKAHNKFKKFTLSEQLRNMAEAREKWRRDYESFIYDAREEGFEKGIQKGIEKGIKKGKISAEEEICKRLIIDGTRDIDKLHKITSLDKTMIKSILEEYERK